MVTILGLGALVLLLAAAAGSLARLAHHLNEDRHDQHVMEQRRRALNALPRVIPPTGVNHPNGRATRPFDWERES